MNSYLDKVLSRLLSAGMLVVLIGALVGYLGPWAVSRLTGRQVAQSVTLGCKVAGCVLVVLGILLLMQII